MRCKSSAVNCPARTAIISGARGGVMKVNHVLITCVFVFISPFAMGDNAAGIIQGNDLKADSPEFFSFHLNPGLEIPLGESSDYFNLGGSINLTGELGIIQEPLLFLSGHLDYNINPIKSEKSLSILAGGLGGGIYLDFTKRLSLKGYTSGGYYYGFLNDGTEFIGGGNPYISAGLGFYYLMTPSISLGIGISYKNYLGLFNGISAFLGTSYYLKGRETRRIKMESGLPLKPDLLNAKIPGQGEGIEVSRIEFKQIFPVFHKYYDDHPIGKVVIRNQEKEPITDIKVSLLIKQYMDAPKESNTPPELHGGESREIDLYALFTEKVLDITEGTKAAAEITLEYELNGVRYKDTKVETIRIYDRNAMTWDDDRKAASFVTAKDTMVLNFSKNVAGLIREKVSIMLNTNLLTAVGIHEAMDLYGIKYVIDPRTPYVEFSGNKNQIDFLQFPRQTLEYRAGDCDDLSILYSALLQSVGIETAFVTTPGHIFIAVSTDLKPEEAVKDFFKADELIFREGKAWIPVEVTERGRGFLKAWQAGAKAWRENETRNQAGFFPMHAAWEQYEPVGLPGGASEIVFPAHDRVLSAYLREVKKITDQAIYPRVSLLQDVIKRTQGSPKARNKLGILYVQYGFMEKAKGEFEKTLSREEYVPALVNLGNLHFLKEDWMKALEYYDRAAGKEPYNPKLLLAIARVHHELENYGFAKRSYDQLNKIDPELAEKFDYLDLKGEAGARAAEVSGVKGVMVWAEE